jgi:hypothetical protein
MLSIAVWLLTVAAAAGACLALWHLRVAEGVRPPPLVAGVLHGLVGAAGLVALLFTLRGPPRGVATGVGSFGTVAAVLFAAAAVTGVGVVLLRRRQLIMAIHASIAITGYALLLAWNSLG